MYRTLLTAAWLISCIYATIPCFWFAAHPFAEKWRARRPSPYIVLVPGWALIIAAVALLSWPWHLLRFYSTPLAWIAALPLFAIGVYVYRRAGERFTHAQLIGRPELEPSREGGLITTGIRSRVRHPVYLAHVCELLAWAVGTGLIVVYALLVFAVMTGAAMIRMEERELERRFGNDYRDYKRRVPAILPLLRRRRDNIEPANSQELTARS